MDEVKSMCLFVQTDLSTVFFCMKSYVTITLNTEAVARLKRNKLPGDSYSDVVLREMPDCGETAGELLHRLERVEVPKANPSFGLRCCPAGGVAPVVTSRENDLLGGLELDSQFTWYGHRFTAS
jgi:hypothetical protein